MFLCVPVLVLDRSLRNVFGHLRILSDPYEKSWYSYDKKCHAYKCKKVGRYTDHAQPFSFVHKIILTEKIVVMFLFVCNIKTIGMLLLNVYTVKSKKANKNM